MPRFRSALLPLSLYLIAAPVAAQEPADRAMVEAFRDSLALLPTPAAVQGVVEREKNGAFPGNKDLGRLRLGWALLRLGQLQDTAPPMIEALLQFYEAGVRHDKWPYAWFGLAATKLGLDDIGAREVRSAHQSAGSGWRWGAADAFLHAVRSDTSYIPAAVELGITVMRTPSWNNYPPVVSALSRAARSGRAGDEVWLVLGRLERHVDSNAAALRAFDTYAALPGADQSLAQIERARTLFALGRREEGEQAYYAGATDPSAAARDQYLKDLSWVADSADQARIAGLAGSEFPAALKEFWRTREASAGRAEATRLMEHYRRWDIAMRRFRLEPALHRQWVFGQVFRSAQTEVDDRGVVYIRHGPPDDRASYLADGVPPNETWVYHRPTGDLVLHFEAALGASGWRLVQGLGAMDLNPCKVPGLLDSRGAIDPRYLMMAELARMDSIRISRMAGQGDANALEFMKACRPGGASETQQRVAMIAVSQSGGMAYFGSHHVEQEQQRAVKDITQAVHTDSDPQRFRRPMEPLLQAFGVGGRAPGQGQLLVLWTLKGSDRPKADTIPGVRGVVYSVRLRANVTDSLGRLIVGTDSVRRYRTDNLLPDGAMLPGLLVFDVPPGSYRVMLTIGDTVGDQGAIRVVPDVPVPAFGSGRPEMSDLVLGIEGSGPFWNAGGARFPLNPRNAWTTREAMEVGFQLEGLPAGTRYKVRIAVADIGADSTTPPRAAVELENNASGTRELVTQSINLRTLRPGRYLLTVSVTAGETVLRRERRIVVVGG